MSDAGKRTTRPMWRVFDRTLAIVFKVVAPRLPQTGVVEAMIQWFRVLKNIATT